MIPQRVYRRAVELTKQQLREALAAMQDNEIAPIEERNAAYDALLESDDFEGEYPLFEAKYPGEFQKIAERRRRKAMEGRQ